MVCPNRKLREFSTGFSEGVREQFFGITKRMRKCPTFSNHLDFFVPGLNVAVEIYGDFWHANPSHFASDKVVYSTLRACDIQANDAARIEKIEQCLGTKIQIIWESAWKANKPLILKRLQELIL
jgi:G:T-mismatch repair DNA endonuclease (very short patch repair protein)